MALPGRPAPIPPIRTDPGAVAATPTTEDMNRLITELNLQLDAIWAALADLDARVVALRG